MKRSIKEGKGEVEKISAMTFLEGA